MKLVFPVATRFLWWCHNISSIRHCTLTPLRTGRAPLTHPAPDHHMSPGDYRGSLIAIRLVSFEGTASGKRAI